MIGVPGVRPMVDMPGLPLPFCRAVAPLAVLMKRLASDCIWDMLLLLLLDKVPLGSALLFTALVLSLARRLLLQEQVTLQLCQHVLHECCLYTAL